MTAWRAAGMWTDPARRLLTYHDPDRFHPVHGDAGILVLDAESRGKFHLALDSDEIHAVAGGRKAAGQQALRTGQRPGGVT